MNPDKTFEEKLNDLRELPDFALFRSSVVDTATIKELIIGHQLKYTEKVIECEEEYKLAEENINDFAKYEPAIQESAINHAEKAAYDPAYAERTKLDRDLILPVQIVLNIKNKKNEVKLKKWHIEYHARLVNRLQDFKRICEERDAARKKKGLLSFIKCLCK